MLPEVLHYFKLVNNHYGCAVERLKRIINSPEPLATIPLLIFFSFLLIRDPLGMLNKCEDVPVLQSGSKTLTKSHLVKEGE